jgi:PKHD-type hydroxylase
MSDDTSRPNTFYPMYWDHVHPYSFWEDVFTPDECQQIIDYGNSTALKNAVTVGVTDIRNSSINWIFPSTETSWIFEKITNHVKVMNDQFFKFDIFGLAEGLQFTEYQAPDNEYRMHTDRLFNSLTRKLSISIQLSDPSTYAGGDLCIFQEENPTILPKKQGTLIAFPSFMLHEVKKVEVGTRYSLVAWVTGKPFV